MDGIANIDDVKSFISCYNHRSQEVKEVVLYSVDVDTGELSSITLNIPKYERIEALRHFLLTRVQNTEASLTGFNLRINGFDELLDSRIPSGIAVTDWHHNDIDQYAIHDDTKVNAGWLSSRLIRLEVINAILPHLEKGGRYKYDIYQDSLTLERRDKLMQAFTEFMSFGKALAERHKYVNVHISNYAFNEFFPKIYICVKGRPYIVFRQGNMGSGYADARSLPCYDVMDCFYEKSDGIVRDLHNQSHYDEQSTSLVEVLNQLFANPIDAEITKNIISQEYKNKFGQEIESSDILYDWVKRCYCFSPSIEDSIFGECSLKPSKDPYFCKYTSLETLMAVLKSGNMRLNSIVSMNDPTETLKLRGEGCNYLHVPEEQEEILKYANYYYITSFTQNQDDLNMWRFYGEKGTGVCLVFEPVKDTQNDVFDVSYLPLDSDMLRNINDFLVSLEKKGIRFCIQSYVEKYLFIKPKEYETENERRLVIATTEPTDFTVYSNNVVTPYIDRKLPLCMSECESAPQDYFPLQLRKIILGPEMKNKEENLRQLKFMIEHKLKRFRNSVEVEISKINCYRN